MIALVVARADVSRVRVNNGPGSRRETFKCAVDFAKTTSVVQLQSFYYQVPLILEQLIGMGDLRRAQCPPSLPAA